MALGYALLLGLLSQVSGLGASGRTEGHMEVGRKDLTQQQQPLPACLPLTLALASFLLRGCF